jgi:hypothetical protein
LLAGLIRCRRCGRKLTLRYTGDQHQIPRYSCTRGWTDNGEPRCIAFGGLRVDDAIEEALLGVVGPRAVTASMAAAEQTTQLRDQAREALDLAFRHSARNLPLNDSMKALSVGLPGRLKSSVTPFM